MAGGTGPAIVGIRPIQRIMEHVEIEYGDIMTDVVDGRCE